ncbi:MAG TPA: SusC/RagA family TonB-linked outer membrane protein [Porphyromonadaceae bacterium]|nr:SusC/RagA family TonB-linked outer membrane protein [Porphyromonadaceae bacterium]HBX19777.1 SusC/RagA family TonB-linked outer membrane protein [Porphyromonadaceae bacterium]HCM19414.1 SusC/RagA family TonB-linked outer membrane protein [Porphyromonadaceae bacterium]
MKQIKFKFRRKKIQVILMICCLQLFTPGRSIAQPITIHQADKSVREIIRIIEKTSDMVFFYNNDDIDLNRKVSLNVNDQPIEKVLDLLFGNTQTTYKIDGRQVYIMKKQAKEERVVQQQKKAITVKGKVTDEKGESLPGATVIIVGSTKGVITDVDGVYSIEVSPTDELEFTYIGMEPQKVKVNNNTTLNIILKEKVDELEEITVVGFGRQKKESVVAAITTVKGEELRVPTRSLSTSLAGQFSGLISVQRSGEPGYDNAEFWIRGVSSFAGGTNPLVLVDGVPREMNDIEPDEIETFTLLKDASATSIYGSEGANGVVLITSKRGREQKPSISYRGEVGVLTPIRIPRFANSYDFLTLYNERLTNDGDAKYIDDVELEKYRTGEDPDLYPSVDWWGTLMAKHTSNTRHTLNFRGGGERMRYFVSGAYFAESGLFKQNNEYNNNAGLKRYNLRSNIDINVTPTTFLRVDLSGQYLTTNYPSSSTSGLLSNFVQVPPHVIPAVYSDGTLSRSSDTWVQPYNELMESGYRKEWRTGLQSKVELEQKLDFVTPGLKVKGAVSYDSNSIYYMTRSKTPAAYYAEGRLPNGNLIFNQITNETPFGTPTTSNSGNKNIYIEGSLNYDRAFDKHAVTGMLLYYQKDKQLHNNALAFRKQAWIGRATYAFDNRYLLEGSFGITGSEQFAKGYRYGIFPAVGLGWNITNEPFFPENWLNTLSSLKLRASVGKTGNDNTGGDRFLYKPSFNDDSGYSWGIGSTGTLNNVGGIIEGRFESPSLSWEIEMKRNYGIDLMLFNGKADLQVDYFDNLRTNILMQRKTISGAAGFRQAPWQNFGKVSNKGVDAAFNVHQIIGDWRLSLKGNFTFARNKILEYDEIPQSYPWMAVTGTRLFGLKGLAVDRLYREDDFNILVDANGNKTYTLREGVVHSEMLPNPMPGDILYVDQNGDGVVDTNYDAVQDYVHPTVPEIMYGFGINATYKGIYVSLFFQGAGNTSLNLNNQPHLFQPFSEAIYNSSVRQEIIESRWTEANPSQDVFFPRISLKSKTNTNSTLNSWFFRDASYLRLKTVELGYTIPEKIAAKVLMKQARIYVMGQNVALLYDKVKMFDPELGNSGAGARYPLTATWSAGLELTF